MKKKVRPHGKHCGCPNPTFVLKVDCKGHNIGDPCPSKKLIIETTGNVGLDNAHGDPSAELKVESAENIGIGTSEGTLPDKLHIQAKTNNLKTKQND